MLERPLELTRSYWGDAFIVDDTEELLGARLYIDDTEEPLGGRDYILTTPDAILYRDGRVYIFGRARLYIWARHVYIWARHEIETRYIV